MPLSLCDYPGHMASVIFTQGCNFRCPWCHNAHLIPLIPPGGADGLVRDTCQSTASEETVLSRLAARRSRINSAVVTGGEPTLHAALPRFLRRIKALGLKVKLDTNGARPDALRDLFAERLLDFVAMDIKAPWTRYAELAGLTACDTDALRESVALIAASGVAHHFRTTRVEPLLSERDCAEILRQLPPGSPHVWQTYRLPGKFSSRR